MKYAHSTMSWPTISRAITSMPRVITACSVRPPPRAWSMNGLSRSLSVCPNGVVSSRTTMAAIWMMPNTTASAA